MNEKKKRYFILYRACCPAVVSVIVTFLFIRFTRKQLSMRISESLLYRYSPSRPAGDYAKSSVKKNYRRRIPSDFFFHNYYLFHSTPPPGQLNQSKTRLYNLRVFCATCKSDVDTNLKRITCSSIILLYMLARIL